MALLTGCPVPTPEGPTGQDPRPEPQQPAPNADPKPSDKPRAVITWRVTQELRGDRLFGYSFRSTDGVVIVDHLGDMAEPFLGLEHSTSFEIDRPGIAKISISTPPDSRAVGNMLCQILYKRSDQEDQTLLAESTGRHECETIAIIT
jgi:hypothetical protein